MRNAHCACDAYFACIIYIAQCALSMYVWHVTNGKRGFGRNSNNLNTARGEFNGFLNTKIHLRTVNLVLEWATGVCGHWPVDGRERNLETDKFGPEKEVRWLLFWLIATKFYNRSIKMATGTKKRENSFLNEDHLPCKVCTKHNQTHAHRQCKLRKSHCKHLQRQNEHKIVFSSWP